MNRRAGKKRKPDGSPRAEGRTLIEMEEELEKTRSALVEKEAATLEKLWELLSGALRKIQRLEERADELQKFKEEIEGSKAEEERKEEAKPNSKNNDEAVQIIQQVRHSDLSSEL